MRRPTAALLAIALAACSTGASTSSSTSSTSSTGGAGGVTGDGGPSTSRDGGSAGGAGGGNSSGASSGPGSGTSSSTPSVVGGAATFAASEQDAPSNGGTITFQDIGAAGWFPSRRDPAGGACDAYSSGTCCMTRKTVTGADLTPWDEDLIMTLRGPMEIKQFVVYQPDATSGTEWQATSAWDSRGASAPRGIAFATSGGGDAKFAGAIGSECLVNVSTDKPFACGPGSVPYCPPLSGGNHAYAGWAGSKLFVFLASMPHADKVAGPCSTGTGGNWYDAPWIGLSHGELVRAGAFSSCQCYAKDPAKWYLGDGCGQFNVFEVVNDNNAYKNLDVFSTNFFGYGGYVGEGPCGAACSAARLGPAVDLIAKATDIEASAGATASPTKGPGTAFRRPESGYRYFLILMDVATRSVQLAIVHPGAIPAAVAPFLPALPGRIPQAAVDGALGLRLPR